MGNDMKCLASDVICGFEPKTKDDIPQKLPHLRNPSQSDSIVFKHSKKTRNNSAKKNENDEDNMVPSKLKTWNSNGKLEMESERKRLKGKKQDRIEVKNQESKRYSDNNIMSPMLSQSQFHSIINYENQKKYKLV
mmetsp:Transcript_50515/g.61943  ORF Transcript_50515/g.61943 Transcript_50515/m.61943 type:complete len:135 (-) Transcript_50515:61-465(-)